MSRARGAAARILMDTQVQARMHKDGTPMPLAFIMLGLAGEGGEALEALDVLSYIDEDEVTLKADALNNLKLELGDVLWYAVAALLDQGTTLDAQVELHGFEHAVRQPLPVLIGTACDMVKKHVWHGKALDRQKLIDTLFAVTVQLGLIAFDHDMKLSDVIHANVEKLNKRYPLETGGFVEGGGVR